MSKTVLHIDSAARYDASFSRKFSKQVVESMGADEVIYRDLAKGVELIDEPWVQARFTPIDQLDENGKQALAYSDTLIAEVKAADTIVIGLPIYNFNVPGALKLWIDQVVRPGATIGYDENGNSFGMLTDKKVIVAIASAGVQPNSPVDFVSSYLEFLFGFLGIKDVEIIWGDRAMFRGDEVFEDFTQKIAALAV